MSGTRTSTARKTSAPAKKAAAKKTTAKKTASKPAAKKTAAKKTASAPKASGKPRAARTDLEPEVLAVCTDYANGKLKVEGGKPLTPHRVAAVVGERRKGGAAPSVGAVAAVFDRWEKYGFALFTAAPKAFKAISAAGKKDGLAGTKAKYRESQKKAKASK